MKEHYSFNFAGCDFTGASLRGAVFPNANFEGSDFTNADLRGGGLEFTNSNFRGCIFDGALMDDDLRDYIKGQANGMTLGQPPSRGPTNRQKPADVVSIWSDEGAAITGACIAVLIAAGVILYNILT